MTPRPDSPGLGLGLPLIANLSDNLEIRDGPDGRGTELVMVVRPQARGLSRRSPGYTPRVAARM